MKALAHLIDGLRRTGDAADRQTLLCHWLSTDPQDLALTCQLLTGDWQPKRISLKKLETIAHDRDSAGLIGHALQYGGTKREAFALAWPKQPTDRNAPPCLSDLTRDAEELAALLDASDADERTLIFDLVCAPFSPPTPPREIRQALADHFSNSLVDLEAIWHGAAELTAIFNWLQDSSPQPDLGPYRLPTNIEDGSTNPDDHLCLFHRGIRVQISGDDQIASIIDDQGKKRPDLLKTALPFAPQGLVEGVLDDGGGFHFLDRLMRDDQDITTLPLQERLGDGLPGQALSIDQLPADCIGILARDPAALYGGAVWRLVRPKPKDLTLQALYAERGVSWTVTLGTAEGLPVGKCKLDADHPLVTTISDRWAEAPKQVRHGPVRHLDWPGQAPLVLTITAPTLSDAPRRKAKVWLDQPGITDIAMKRTQTLEEVMQTFAFTPKDD